MPFIHRKTALAIVGAAAIFMQPFAAAALPSTAKGQISVGQVMEMIEKAGTNPVARQTLVAYVAGVGEAAGVVVETIGNGDSFACKTAFKLDTGSVRAALQTGAPRQSTWAETPATPLIIADMVKRAGCRIRN